MELQTNDQIAAMVARARRATGAQRDALRAELLAAAAAIAMAPTRATRGPAAARLRWPRIGGEDLVVRRNPAIDTDAYRARWVASDMVTWIYALGCPGVQALAANLKLPLFKIGSTSGRVQDRLAELGRDGYGASYRSSTGMVREAGFGPGEWVAEQLPTTVDLSVRSPVHVSIRAIGVRLPVGLSAMAFEKALSAEVGNAALQRLVSGPAGQALCVERGVDPARCRRFTGYRFGADTRSSRESELAVFRPRTEADRLVAIAERIVVRHVMGLGR